MMGLIFRIFYFVLILPMKNKQRKLEDLVKRLKSGDKVILNPGIFGTIVGVEDDAFQVRIDDKTRIRVLKSAVAGLQGTEPEKRRRRRHASRPPEPLRALVRGLRRPGGPRLRVHPARSCGSAPCSTAPSSSPAWWRCGRPTSATASPARSSSASTCAGGIHLVLQVVTDDALNATIDDAVATVRDQATRKGIVFASAQRVDPTSFSVEGVEPARVKDMRDLLKDFFRDRLGGPRARRGQASWWR